MSTWGGAARLWAGGAVGFSEFPYSYNPGPFASRARFDSTYCYHWYTTSGGSIIPLAGRVLPATVDLFLVGGGGLGDEIPSPGPGPAGGGGGAGTNLVLGVPAFTSPQLTIIGSGGNVFFGGGNGGQTVVGAHSAAGGFRAGIGTGVGGNSPSFSGSAASGNAGGGGAGAAGVGTAGSGSQGGNGGPGVANDWITGSPVFYGVGGRGDGTPGITPGTPSGSPTRGSGGPAGGAFGGGGVVIMRYLRQY